MEMKALITGASSGIGKEMAKVLASRGWDLIVVARRESLLLELKEELAGCDVKVCVCDLSQVSQVKALCKTLKDEPIEMVINNAGFGDLGYFDETDEEKELNMINTNITALHLLTKYFVKRFKQQNHGYILNVASIAAFAPGPMMATYYATKAYVLRLSLAINKELQKAKSNVRISVLCPGPVKTEFNKVANSSFAIAGMNAKEVAEYAIDQTLQKKQLIFPGIFTKLAHAASGMVSQRFASEVVYHIQKARKE